VGLWWVPGLVSRLDCQHKALGEAHLLCRGRQARAGEPPRGSVSRPARSTRSYKTPRGDDEWSRMAGSLRVEPAQLPN
jgi:hypothetical protein